jgi:hypothetical protein
MFTQKYAFFLLIKGFVETLYQNVVIVKQTLLSSVCVRDASEKPANPCSFWGVDLQRQPDPYACSLRKGHAQNIVKSKICNTT